MPLAFSVRATEGQIFFFSMAYFCPVTCSTRFLWFMLRQPRESGAHLNDVIIALGMAVIIFVFVYVFPHGTVEGFK